MRNDNGNYLDVQLDISAHQSLPAVATNVQFTQCRVTGHKVIHPKYYKHLKKGAHQSHLGRQKMGWFLAD